MNHLRNQVDRVIPVAKLTRSAAIGELMATANTYKDSQRFDWTDEYITNFPIGTLHDGPRLEQCDTPKSLGDAPGIYTIRCLANDATYTGSSIRLHRRLSLHVSLLRSGASGVTLLQRDWDTYGEDRFEFMACHKPLCELADWEERITLLTDSLDDYGGYNRMLGNRVWSLSSRIMNTEQKLIKKGKFAPLTELYSNPRLTDTYRHTFCQGNTPFFKSESLIVNAMDKETKRAEFSKHLGHFVRFDPATPRRTG